MNNKLSYERLNPTLSDPGLQWCFGFLSVFNGDALKSGLQGVTIESFNSTLRFESVKKDIKIFDIWLFSVLCV